MKTTTLFGALAGAAVLTAGGFALAGKRKSDDAVREPFFLYVMQSGDTLSALAFKFFGDAQKWPVLAEANAALLTSDKNVPVGAKIRVPCIWEAAQKGDTLASVAKRTLGDAGRWRRIAEANKPALPDPNKLAVGQLLAVPKESGAAGSGGQSAIGDLDMLGAERLP